MSTTVWICLSTIFIISILISPILFPKFGGLLGLAGLLLGVSLSYDPAMTSHKIFFITWGTMGYVISQFYLASLAKNLLIGDTSRINSVKELINSDLKLVADIQLSWVYTIGGSNSDYEYDNYVQARLVYKSKVEIDVIESKLLSGKIQDTAILMAQNFSSAKLDLGNYAHQLQEITAGYPLAFAIWRGLPILTKIDAGISALFESGFVTHWSNEFSRVGDFVVEDNTEKHVGLNELFPAFLLMFFGYSMASLVLLLEIICKKCFIHK